MSKWHKIHHINQQNVINTLSILTLVITFNPIPKHLHK